MDLLGPVGILGSIVGAVLLLWTCVVVTRRGTVAPSEPGS